MNIIEYIGKEGVTSTGPNETSVNRRLCNPQPGDVLIWDEGLEYPFHKNGYGRFENFGTWDSKKWHICVGGASVFLYPDGVSISGGPFTSIHPDEIEPTYQTKLVSFWNWGSNGPGAGKGVEYFIERPVFKLKRAVMASAKPSAV